MEVLNWITNNWVNILAFMGALNILAQTLMRTGNKEGAVAKVGQAMGSVASLGALAPKRATPPVKDEGDDEVIPPSV